MLNSCILKRIEKFHFFTKNKKIKLNNFYNSYFLVSKRSGGIWEIYKIYEIYEELAISLGCSLRHSSV